MCVYTVLIPLLVESTASASPAAPLVMSIYAVWLDNWEGGGLIELACV